MDQIGISKPKIYPEGTKVEYAKWKILGGIASSVFLLPAGLVVTAAGMAFGGYLGFPLIFTLFGIFVFGLIFIGVAWYFAGIRRLVHGIAVRSAGIPALVINKNGIWAYELGPEIIPWNFIIDIATKPAIFPNHRRPLILILGNKRQYYRPPHLTSWLATFSPKAGRVRVPLNSVAMTDIAIGALLHEYAPDNRDFSFQKIQNIKASAN